MTALLLATHIWLALLSSREVRPTLLDKWTFVNGHPLDAVEILVQR